MRILSIILLSFVLWSCNEKQAPKTLSADHIINKSIEASGGEKFERSAIDFNFRGRAYIATREQGKFSLIRVMSENSTNLIIDQLNNEGFSRKFGTSKHSEFKTITVADSMIPRYSASVNSVHYFSVLPYGLNDKAVHKALLDEEKIKGKEYYKIKVTFDQEGGGEDFEDIFVYWIDKALFKLHYLAYSYNEDDGKGMRFREAYNERFVNSLRFVDYNNYKAKDTTIQISDLGRAFENNQLQLLSKIELENITVDLIDL